MDKAVSIIKKTIQWLLFGFMLLMALGSAVNSAKAAVFLFAMAGVVMSPFGRRIADKIKPGIKGKYIAIFSIILLLTAFGAMVGAEPTPTPQGKTDELQVHFIDVGQGDCTLIKCGDAAMLIDAADDSKGTAIQNYLNKQGVKKLDYLILTHPDADHIGAAPVIITKFEIDNVFMSDHEKNTKTYSKVIQALDYKRLKYITPSAGTAYALGSAEFTILAPNKSYSDANNASIALLIKNGENAFLFTGDGEEEAESDILAAGLSVNADVYLAGHHGSKTASSEGFLNNVSPAYVVISCGEGNSYGHPHAQTLNTLRAMGVKVFRTDEQGTIIASSDGTNITWNCAPSESWIAGEPTRSGGGGDNTSDIVQEGAPAVQIQIETPAETPQPDEAPQPVTDEWNYVLNSKNKKFHLPTCKTLPANNREDTNLSREEILNQGYQPCKNCNP